MRDAPHFPSSAPPTSVSRGDSTGLMAKNGFCEGTCWDKCQPPLVSLSAIASYLAVKGSLEHWLLTRGEREGGDVSHRDGRIRCKAACEAAPQESHDEIFTGPCVRPPPRTVASGAAGAEDVQPRPRLRDKRNPLPFARGPQARDSVTTASCVHKDAAGPRREVTCG